MSPSKNRKLDFCPRMELRIHDQAFVFCSQILSWAESGAVVGSNVTGSCRESPTVEKDRTTPSSSSVSPPLAKAGKKPGASIANVKAAAASKPADLARRWNHVIWHLLLRLNTKRDLGDRFPLPRLATNSA